MESKRVLHPELYRVLRRYREQRSFDAVDWVEQKAKMFNEYMRHNELSGCVVSCSGGIDSSVVLALAAYASQFERSPIKRIVGIMQPIQSTMTIQNRAGPLGARLAETGAPVEMITVDQTPVFQLLQPIVDEAIGVKGSQFASGQLKSYMRTPVTYYVAQLLAQEGTPALVLGTGNYDEDGFLMYFCKAGDGTTDLQLIADLHKSEVTQVGQILGVPRETLVAPSTADLWDAQTDEDELGFPYDFIELLTQALMHGEDPLDWDLSDEATKQFREWSAKAHHIHRRNKHKAVFPVDLNVLQMHRFSE
jgi:NAD+ synthase (glutamine-hydrolysing)